MSPRIPTELDNSRSYETDGDVVIAWPEDMGELAKEEAAYHDMFDEDAIAVHRLDAWRNVYYHKQLWHALKSLDKGSRLLEVGAGSGFDAKELVRDYSLVLTDISPKTLQRLRDRVGDDSIDYVAADGEKLPFITASFDGVYMVATWHHLEHPEVGIREFYRVLKPGGKLVIGVEPNITYFAPIKWIRPLLVKLTHMGNTDVSHADEEMVGFSHKHIELMMAKDEWENIEIRPMWLFAGFFHYALEFFFRAFKLKKRLSLPQWLEKIIVAFDEFLFAIPGVKHLCWHWIITAEKR